jgi:hypothetical protein
MTQYTAAEKDKVLCRVADRRDRRMEVDMKKDPDRDIIQHLLDLRIFEKDPTKGFSDNTMICLADKGAELYANAGFKGERKKDIIETLWKAFDTLKPW